MSKQPKPKPREIFLRNVRARVYDPKTLFLRTGMAKAKAEDGREYEVSSNINGDSVLVRRFKPDSGPWLVFSSRSLVEAYVTALEREKTRKNP